MRGQAVRNALEIDGAPVYAASGQEGMEEDGADGVLTRRRIDASTLDRLKSASTLGFSVDGINGNWTRAIEVSSLRDKIAYYTRTCGPRP